MSRFTRSRFTRNIPAEGFCGMCARYYEADRSGDIPAVTGICNGKTIKPSNDSCYKYTLSSAFNCPAKGYWTSPSLCKIRKHEQECVKCKYLKIL